MTKRSDSSSAFSQPSSFASAFKDSARLTSPANSLPPMVSPAASGQWRPRLVAGHSARRHHTDRDDTDRPALARSITPPKSWLPPCAPPKPELGLIAL